MGIPAVRREELMTGDQTVEGVRTVARYLVRILPRSGVVLCGAVNGKWEPALNGLKWDRMISNTTNW